MNVLKVFILSMLAMLLTSCGLTTPVKLAEVSTYTITSLDTVAIPSKVATRSTLLVTSPIADPGYETNAMVYVDVPFKLKHFANNSWISPPADMLLPLLAQQIRRHGYFAAVVTTPFSGSTDYRLDTRLLVLQQEFLKPTSQVRLVIQASILNNLTNHVVASKRFSVTVIAAGNNPYSGVLATNQAAKTVTSKIATFVMDAVKRR